MDREQHLILRIVGGILGVFASFLLGAKAFHEFTIGLAIGSVAVPILFRLSGTTSTPPPAQCDRCGHKADDEAQFCPNCNAPLSGLKLSA